MFEKTKSPADIAMDRAAFVRWVQAANDGPDAGIEHALALVGRALREETTEKQLAYISDYYLERMNMQEIAEKYGVDRSVVSRTIKRGLVRIERVLKYSNPSFLRESLGGIPDTGHRNRRRSGYIRKKRIENPVDTTDFL